MDAANAYSTRQDRRNARAMAYTAAARNDVIRLYGDDRKFASVTRLVAMAREIGISPDSGKSAFLKIRTAGKLPAGRLQRKAVLVAWKLYVLTSI